MANAANGIGNDRFTKGGSGMRSVAFLRSVLCGLMAGVVANPPVLAQSEHVAQLIEGAKKEGQLDWYTSMSVVDNAKYLELFTKKYPFIKLNVRRVGGERLVTIITTEHRAGKSLFDVVISSGVAPSLIKSGIFAKYLSPEYKYFSPGTKDAEGYWADTYTNSLALTYNTRMVPKDKVPQRWEDLLAPQWKGKKIAIDTEPYEWFDAVLRIMGKEKGWDYLKRFGEQELAVVRGNNLRAVDWIGNEHIFVVNLLHPVFVSAKAEHPNAARLFVEFCLSKEAQQLLVQLGRKASSRMDVATDVPKAVRFVPEDLSIYDRINEARADIEKLLFRSTASR